MHLIPAIGDNFLVVTSLLLRLDALPSFLKVYPRFFSSELRTREKCVFLDLLLKVKKKPKKNVGVSFINSIADILHNIVQSFHSSRLVRFLFLSFFFVTTNIDASSSGMHIINSCYSF